MSNAEKAFNELVARVRERYDDALTMEELEPDLVAIAGVLASSPDERGRFSSKLVDLMSSGEAPIEIVEFSMHELKWGEVRRGALELLEGSNVWDQRRRAEDVVAAFEDSWEDAELYGRFR